MLLGLATVAACTSSPGNEPTESSSRQLPSESSSSGAVGSAPQLPTSGSPTAAYVEFFLDQPEAEDMAQDHRQALIAAAEADELTYDTLRELISDTFDCFEENGISARFTADDTSHGIPVPTYTFSEIDGLTTDESLAIADSCIARHSGAAEMIYVWQPVSAAAIHAEWEANMKPFMVTCLRGEGITVDDSATREEIDTLAFELWTNATSEGEAPSGPNCFP